MASSSGRRTGSTISRARHVPPVSVYASRMARAGRHVRSFFQAFQGRRQRFWRAWPAVDQCLVVGWNRVRQDATRPSRQSNLLGHSCQSCNGSARQHITIWAGHRRWTRSSAPCGSPRRGGGISCGSAECFSPGSIMARRVCRPQGGVLVRTSTGGHVHRHAAIGRSSRKPPSGFSTVTGDPPINAAVCENNRDQHPPNRTGWMTRGIFFARRFIDNGCGAAARAEGDRLGRFTFCRGISIIRRQRFEGHARKRPARGQRGGLMPGWVLFPDHEAVSLSSSGKVGPLAPRHPKRLVLP